MRALLLLALVTSTASAAPDPQLAKIIKKAATDYQKWGRVDERPNIAPDLCRAPTPADYGQAAKVRLSEAEDGPHQKKLFYLWASDRLAYEKMRIANGFAVVKQSFTAKPHARGKAKTVNDAPFLRSPTPITWLETSHGALEIDQPKELFIMAKTSESQGTDQGWIYGTVSTDGTVTSAGALATCMACHSEAPHGRLFGLPSD